MSSSNNYMNTIQPIESLNLEKVNGNNVKQTTVSAVKSPSPPPSTHLHIQPTSSDPSPQVQADKEVKYLVEGFPFAPKKLVESEKTRGMVSSTWDGDLRTFIQNVKPCPMCSFPKRGSGCGYCH